MRCSSGPSGPGVQSYTAQEGKSDRPKQLTLEKLSQDTAAGENTKPTAPQDIRQANRKGREHQHILDTQNQVDSPRGKSILTQTTKRTLNRAEYISHTDSQANRDTQTSESQTTQTL